jgi:hypothetical protein
MEKVGELKTRLSERLSQRQAEELAEVATLTEANLTQLSERLTKHVSAELSTTRDAIRQQSEQITTLLGSQQSALEQQQATVDALKRLSLTDLEQIQKGLNDAITIAQGKAIEQEIDPLRTALEQLKTDGEALSLVTFRGWLKPLLIASAVILGAGGSTWAVATILANQITGQLTDLQILNQQISTAQETLDRLPKGITFAVSKGKKYVVASQIGDPYKTESGEMAVEIK